LARLVRRCASLRKSAAMWQKLCLLLAATCSVAYASVLRQQSHDSLESSQGTPPPIVQGANCRFMEKCQDGTECGCYTNSCMGGVSRVGGDPFAWEKDAIPGWHLGAGPAGAPGPAPGPAPAAPGIMPTMPPMGAAGFGAYPSYAIAPAAAGSPAAFAPAGAPAGAPVGAPGMSPAAGPAFGMPPMPGMPPILPVVGMPTYPPMGMSPTMGMPWSQFTPSSGFLGAPAPAALGAGGPEQHLWGCECCARYDGWFIGKYPFPR